MGLCVTGISQHGDLKPLEKALSDAGFSVDPIQLIGPDDSESNLADMERSQRSDSDIMLGGGQGTGVP
ncbi:MAG: hypothetical protein ACRENA_12755, partial [Vulcanimicrobiaceae bacterium]